ncbi:MAG: hypothetical protein U0Y82_09930 [Thermoleophilia bacterium]
MFLHPSPERDEEGAVFLLDHGEAGEAVWMTTRWDPADGRIQHVYVLPGVQAVQIDLRLEGRDGGTGVTVRYRRTSLAEAWDGHVTELGRRDPEQGDEWRRAIMDALGASAAGA